MAKQSEKWAPAGFACEKKTSQLHFTGVYYCKLCKFSEKSYLFVPVWAFKSSLFQEHLIPHVVIHRLY